MYKNRKITIKTLIKYYDLPFGDHPQDEFGVRILRLCVFLWFYYVVVDTKRSL